jgi:hypothetical protein
VLDLSAPLPHPLPAAAPTARILAAVAALTLGAFTFFSGVKVKRISLLAYNVAGFVLDLDEVPAEVAYLEAEREAIREEPSLYRAAEIVQRQLLTGSRGLSGRFSVRSYVVGGARVWSAVWCGGDMDLRCDRIALEDLAAWARDMGLAASRIGFEVIATLPPALRPRPSLAKTVARAASRAA